MDARARVTDPEPQLGLLFGALSDPARRQMFQSLLSNGSATVPALTADLPITRQAVAKHLTALEQAGLVHRQERSGRREVVFEPTPDALAPALDWLAEADAAWAKRLARLKAEVEHKAEAARQANGPSAR